MSAEKEYYNYTMKALDFLHSKDYKNAIPLFIKARDISIDPNEYNDSYIFLASCYEQEEEYDNVISTCINCVLFFKGDTYHGFNEDIYKFLNKAYQGLFFKKNTTKHHQSIINKCEKNLHKFKNNILWQTNFLILKNKLINLHKDYEYISDESNGSFHQIQSLQEFYDIIKKKQNRFPSIAYRGYIVK